MTELLVGVSTFVLICLTNLSVGFTADKEWKAVLVQPFIAITWAIGAKGIANKGVGVFISYVVASTLGAAAGIWIRRRRCR